MRVSWSLFLFLTWMNRAMGSPPIRNCEDCKDITLCAAAKDLLANETPENNEQLKSVFCGYRQEIPKVCCSELQATAQSRIASADSVETHPNLRLLPEDCGETILDKIIGGHAARLYEYPWMSLLSYKRRDGLQFDCGGSLINEFYVLTAAHCVANQPLAGVRVGDLDYATNTDCEGEPPTRICESSIQDRHIQKIIIHPEYTTKARRDIALLRFKKKIDLSYRNARTVCLPITRQLQDRALEGLNATVAGWGLVESGEKSTKLMSVDLPITSKESCGSHLSLFNRRGQGENYTICAGAANVDSCIGDSGGPLMLRGIHKGTERLIEYGIVSRGPRDCGSGQAAVYTDVVKHMKWILDNIEP